MPSAVPRAKLKDQTIAVAHVSTYKYFIGKECPLIHLQVPPLGWFVLRGIEGCGNSLDTTSQVK